MAYTSPFKLIENYIYIYQLDKYVIIPTYPDSLSDNLGSTFSTSNPLARTAPIYSYSYSGPRSVRIQLKLHRDMVNEENFASKQNLLQNSIVAEAYNDKEGNSDYVDILIRYLQAMALPSYASATASKMLNPPMIAVRFGNTLFIKGIVNGNVGVDYSGPISEDGKYQVVDINFDVNEVDPQDAETISQWGSFRGLEKVLTRNLYKGNGKQ